MTSSRLPLPFALRITAFLLALAFAGVSARAATQIVYVRADAPAGGNGQSWASAFNSLQSALAAVTPTSANPVEIWLKTGVYRPTTGLDRSVSFVLKNYLTLRGGFAGTETSPDQRIAASAATSFTVLSGDIGSTQADAVGASTAVNLVSTLALDVNAAAAKDNSYNVLRASGVAASLDRLVVAGGYANSPAIDYSRIETLLYPSNDSVAGFRQSLDAGVNGGGLYALSSSVDIRDCWFVGNFAGGAGGGLASRGGYLHLEGTTLARNFAGYAGGGAFAQGTFVDAVDRDTFYGNTAVFLGGGLFLQADTDNTYVKSYVGNAIGALISIAFDTTADATAPTDTHVPFDYIKLIQSSAFLARKIQTTVAKEANFANLATKGLTVESAAAGLSLFYAYFSITVSAVDIGVEIALALGADPNDPFIHGWTIFSTGFATYATPLGIAKLLYNLIPFPQPSFESRAYPIRLADYENNQNLGSPLLLRQNRFEKNYSGGFGGAAVVLRANAVFSRTWFVANESIHGGGALAAFAYNDVDVENSAALGNASTYGPSAFMFGYRTVNRLVGDTLTGNHSDAATGYAVSADAGADTSLLNCILWSNTNGVLADPANPNRSGGADLFATRKADLVDAALKAYSDSGDAHGLVTAIMDVQYCDVEGLPRLPYGTTLFYGAPNTSSDASGTLVADKQFNLGEGIRPANGVRGNISSDPLLIQDIYPHPSSPAINAGTPYYPFFRGSNSDLPANTTRPLAGRYDIGAVESNGTLPAGTTLYVDAARASSGDGLSWATAFKTLPEALAAPLNPGSQIWVAQGTYYPTTGTSRSATMTLAPGVSLIGGFASGATSIDQSDPVAHPTILSGNIGNAASSADNSYALLDGRSFPATGASAGTSWEIYNLARQLPRIVRGFRFTAANSTGATGTYAAVRLAQPAIVQSCTFDAHAGGRALLFEDSADLAYRSVAKVLDCVFDTNSAGAIAASSVLKLEVYRSNFFDNTAVSGAAIFQSNPSYNVYSLLKVERSLFYHNVATAGRGGAIATDVWYLDLAHTVLADNEATPASGDTSTRGGAGLWWTVAPDNLTRGGAGLSLTNNILYGNRLTGSFPATPLEFQQFGMPYMESYWTYSRRIASNDLEGLLSYATGTGSSGNVDYDPFFVNPSARDFTLASDSLLLNRGTAFDSATDGVAVVGTTDIGRFEDPSSTAVSTPRPLTFASLTPTDSGRQFTLRLTTTASTSDYVWQVRRPGASGFSTVADDSHTAGATTAQLTFTNPPRNWNGSVYRLAFVENGGWRAYSDEFTLDVPASFLFVVPGGAGAKDGSDWANAFASPTDAILASTDGTQIWIARGTYAIPLTALPPGVRIFGGFVGNESSIAARPAFDPDTTAAADRTILTNTQGGLFTLSGAATFQTLLDRIDLTRTGGGYNSLIVATGASVRFNQVRAANASSTGILLDGTTALFDDARIDTIYYGGVRAVHHSTVQINHAQFTTCGTTSGNGVNDFPALSADSSTLSVADSTFSGNRGLYAGALMVTGDATLSVQRSVFTGNTSTNSGHAAGALLFASSSPGLVANSLFTANANRYNPGAAVRHEGSNSLTLLHCTVAGNAGTLAYASAALYGQGALLHLKNSIAWGNTGADAAGYVGVENSLLGGPYDPLFADAASSDFQLTARSPAVNAVATFDADAGSTDLLGQPRKYAAGLADLGAYEFQSAAGNALQLFTRPAAQTVYAENPVSTAVVANIPFLWQYDNGSAWVDLPGTDGWTGSPAVTTTAGLPSVTSPLTHAHVPPAFIGASIRAIDPFDSSVVLPFALTVAPRYVRYVDSRVASSGDGTSWATAFKTLSDALNHIDGGADLWIAGGTYLETTTVGAYVGTAGGTYLPAVANVRYFPGFAGGETDIGARDLAAHPVELGFVYSSFPYTWTDTYSVPTVPRAFPRIQHAPAATAVYRDRPAAFNVDGGILGGVYPAFDWQYSSDGFTWRPISELSGNINFIRSTGASTLVLKAVTAAMDGWRFRATVVGSTESSLPATLTVKPRHDLFVNPSVSASGDGESWASAFKTIAEALAAADDGADIHLAAGLYTDTQFTVPAGAQLYPDSGASVVFQGPHSTYTFADTAAFNQLRFHLAAPVRSQSACVDQPVIFTASRSAWSTLVPTWQYSSDSGATWQSVDGLAGWSISFSGNVSTLSHASATLGMDGLRFRVVFGDNLEVSNSATLSVRARHTVFVNAAVSASGDGTSWAAAFKTLSAALAVANSGADLWIAAGTYHEATHPIVSGARLYGGFAGTESALDQRDPATHVVTLSSPSGSIFTGAALLDAATLFDGFTLDCANASGQPGVNLTGGASPIFHDVHFTGHPLALLVTGDADVFLSGCAFVDNVDGLSVAGGSLTLENCILSGNTGAAATANDDCAVTIDSCLFDHNGAAGNASAGALRLVPSTSRPTVSVSDSTFNANASAAGAAIGGSGDLVVVRSRFTGNRGTANGAGAIGVQPGVVDIRDSLFAANQTANGSSAVEAGRLALTHVTVADNVATGSTGRAVSGSPLFVRNSILWANTAAGSSGEYAAFDHSSGVSTYTLDHAIVQGLNTAGDQVLPFNPRFVDPASGDYRLYADSPAIDYGSAAFVTADETDLAGAARNQLAAPDLGAFEAASATTPSYDFGLPVSVNRVLDGSFTLSQSVPTGYTSAWQYFDGSAWQSLTTVNSGPYARNLVVFQGTVTVTGLKAAANGLQLRNILFSSSDTFVSGAITISVIPFDIIYVDASRAASGDGASWSAAYKTFTEALAAVSSTRRTIYLAEGSYPTTAGYVIPQGISVYGGFPAGGADFASRNPAAHPAVLSGATPTQVISFGAGNSILSQSLLEGVTVANGQTGLKIDGYSPTLRNLTVTGHSAGGLEIRNSQATVETSTFENNTAVNGGAISVLSGGPVTLDRLKLRANTAARGGGLYILYGTANLTSSLVSGNVAISGGGLYSQQGAINVLQSTVASNRSSDGAGAYVATYYATIALKNSIVWGNLATAGGDNPTLYSVVGYYSSLFPVDHSVVDSTSLTLGAFRQDPLFTSPAAPASAPTAAGDYTLPAWSPARDIGANALASGLALDLAGAPRLANAVVDPGAYEAADAAVTPFALTAQPASLAYHRSGIGNTFTVTATGYASIEWQIAAPSGSWTSLVGNPSWVGASTATLTVANATYLLNGYRIRAVLTAGSGTTLATTEAVLTVYTPRYYVNAAASSSGDGRTWATAFASLDAALAAIPYDPEGTELWIASGAYTPATSFNLNPGLALYGGFAGTESALSERDPVAHVTALVGASGQPAVVKVLAANPTGPALTLDSLTIRDSSGLGIDNTVGRDLSVSRVRFTGLAQALAQTGGSLVVRRSEFRGNGGASVSVAPLSATNCAVTVENTLFAGNVSGYISAASFNAGATMLRHVTVAGNYGPNALLFSDANIQVYNSVVWGNRSASGPVSFASTRTLYIARNCVTDSLAAFNSFFPNRSGLVSTDPAFVSPVVASATPTTSGDYTLATASSAIDAGLNAFTTTDTVDLAGNPRQHALYVDAGAYEYQADDAYALTAQPTNTNASAGTPAVFTVAGSRAAAFVWETSSDSGANWSAVSGATSASLSVAGSPAVDGRLYRARVQFATGPELVSNSASLTYLNVAATVDGPGGYATPSTFSATATQPVSTWQWQLSVDGGATYSDVASATADTLVVQGNASYSGRRYRVRATFTAGPVLVSNAVAFTYANAVPASVSTTGPAFSLSGGVQPASLTDASFALHADLSGRLLQSLGDFTPSFAGDNVAFAFADALPAGARVFATATSALRRADGVGARPRVWEFRAPVTSGSGVFDTQSTLSATAATAFALGDLDGDATIDVLLADSAGLRVWRNDGLGAFTADSSAFGPTSATAVVLGSLTANSSLDAVAITAAGDVEIYTNDASGAFTLAQTISGVSATALALGDLDADGDLDLFVATTSGNRVYINNGSAAFTLGSSFGSGSASSVALGDLDLDGDLDAVVTGSFGIAGWRNDGAGTFSAGFSGPAASAADRVVLADIDNDGRDEIILSRANGPVRVWRTTDLSFVSALSNSPGGGAIPTLAVGDVDGDGRVDLVLTDALGQTGAWLGSAAKTFARAADQLPLSFGANTALADLDGDGALDLFGLDASSLPAVAFYQIVSTRTDEDTPAAISLNAYEIVTAPAHGALSGTAPSLTYTPDPDFNGYDTFTYRLVESGPLLAWHIIVRPVNDAVNATADGYSLDQGATLNAASVLANDLNLDAGTLAASLVTRPAHGALTLNADGTFTYIHDNTETRSDAFTYRATNLSTGVYADAVVSLTIANINAAPAAPTLSVAAGTHYTGQPSGETVATLSATDADPEDAGLLIFTLVAGSGDTNNADFSLSTDGVLTTAAVIDASGGLTRAIRVRVSDPAGLYAEQTFNVAFTRAPTAVAGSASTNEDTAVAINLSGIGGATTLAYEIVSAPAHGSLSGTAPALTYAPATDYNGSDSFTFRVTDGALVSSAATVDLSIAPVNDAPVFYHGYNLSATEDTPLEFTLDGSDVDGDTLTYYTDLYPGVGTLSFSGQTATFTPTANYNGSAQFVIYAVDGHGGTSEDAQFFITVASVPDAPTLHVDVTTRNLLKDTTDTFTTTGLNYDGIGLSLRLLAAPSHGTVYFNGLEVTYIPEAHYAGTDSYTLVSTNGSLDSAPVTISVNLSDPAPTALDDSITINQRGSGQIFLNGTDPQGDLLAFDTVTAPAHGSYVIEFVDVGYGHYANRLTYTPNPAFFGTDTFVFQTRDPNGNLSDPATITFNVTEDNLAPTADALAVTRSGLSTSVALTLSGSDPEGAALTHAIVTPPTHGTLSGDGAALTYTPDTIPYVGDDSFTFTVSDGVNTSAPATVALTFEHDDREPLAMDDDVNVYRGLPATLDVLANDTDPWGNPLHVSSVTQGAHGTVINQHETVLYIPTDASTGTDTFTYTATTEDLHSSTEVTVHVTLVDHVLTVTSADDSGPGTLRAALAVVDQYPFTLVAGTSAPPTWTINLANSLTQISLNTIGDSDATLGDSAFYLRGKAVIQSADLDGCILRRDFYADAFRFFRLAHNASLTLRHVTLTGGLARLGGAIYNEGKLVLDGATLAVNTARAGGSAPGLGGAIYQFNGTSKLLGGSVISDNIADSGGGLYQVGDSGFPATVNTLDDPLYSAFSVVIADGVTFSGHGAAKDFRSVTAGAGTADFLALDLTAEAPSAPWVDAVPSDTVRSTYRATVAVLLDAGQSLSTVNLASTVTGSGSYRTITSAATPLVDYPPVAVASGSGVTFRREFNYTIDSGVDHPPILRDDYVSLGYGETLTLDPFALRNDEDPDGDELNIINIPDQTLAGSINYIGGYNVYTAPSSGSTDTIVYSYGAQSATIHVTLHAHDYGVSSDDSDTGSLREGVALANQFNSQTWTFRSSADNQFVSLTSTGDADATLGDSALLITGDVVIDGSDHEGFTLQGDNTRRLFHVAPGGRLTLRHVTVQGGSAHLGGAIYNEGTVVLDHATLTANTATAEGSTAPGLGGAIFNAAGSLAVTDSVLELNTADDASASAPGLGGAIYTRDFGLTLTGSSLIDNVAHSGGGLFAEVTDADVSIVLVSSILDNPDSAYDLSSSASGTGTIAFHRTSSAIRNIAGPWVSALENHLIETRTAGAVTATDSIPFTASDDLSGLTLGFGSSNQTVLPDANISLTYDGFIHRIQLSTTITGVTDCELIATGGAISFHEHFQLLVNAGSVVPPTAYPQSSYLYAHDFVTIDPFNGMVYDSAGNPLSGGNGPATDSYGLGLVLDSVTQPAHGTVTITADNRLRYTHTDTSQESGTDEFAYTIRNVFGATATSGVFVQIDAVPPPETVVTTMSELSTALATSHGDTPWTIRIVAGSDQTWSTPSISFADNLYTAFRLYSGHLIIDAADSPGFTLNIGAYGPPPRFFVVDAGATLELKNLRLLGAAAYDSFGQPKGGAVLNRGTFTADHVTFQNNSTYSYGNGSGGAIYNDAGTVTLTDCAFTFNTANNIGYGGAIYSRNGTLSLTRVTFSGNSATTARDVYVLGDGATATVNFNELAAAPAYVFATAAGGAISAPGLPVAVSDTVIRSPGQSLKISLASLFANDTGTAGATVTWSESDEGVTLTRSGSTLFYVPDGVETDDRFTYTITNPSGFTSTATVTIHVEIPDPTPTATTLSVTPHAGGATLRLIGVPGRTYTIEASSDLETWETLGTAVADSQGLYTIEDPVESSSRFYRATYTTP